MCKNKLRLFIFFSILWIFKYMTVIIIVFISLFFFSLAIYGRSVIISKPKKTHISAMSGLEIYFITLGTGTITCITGTKFSARRWARFNQRWGKSMFVFFVFTYWLHNFDNNGVWQLGLTWPWREAGTNATSWHTHCK